MVSQHLWPQDGRMDAAAWFMNVSTSVLIVFVNKRLLDPSQGHGFTYGEVACMRATHLATTSWLCVRTASLDVYLHGPYQASLRRVLVCPVPACNLICNRYSWQLMTPGLMGIMWDARVVVIVIYPACAATTLCAFHFLACAAVLWAVQSLGLAKRAKIPWLGKHRTVTCNVGMQCARHASCNASGLALHAAV